MLASTSFTRTSMAVALMHIDAIMASVKQTVNVIFLIGQYF